MLEVDPDNATARRQVGQVATAVRQFDQTAPGRRWLKKLRKQTRFRRWMASWNPEGESGTSLLNGLFWFILIFGALMVGYVIGVAQHEPASRRQSAGNQEGRETREGQETAARGRQAREGQQVIACSAACGLARRIATT